MNFGEVRAKDQRLLGWQWRTENYYFFFGSRHVGRRELVELFPQYRFFYLRQVHGRNIVKAPFEVSVEADGHWTDLPGQALAIQTADCAPVLLAEKNRVLALHAGWRGVVSGILSAALNMPGPATDAPTICAVGPHILAADFEVGREVAEQLQHACPAAGDLAISPHPNPNKRFVDLALILRKQLELARPMAQFHNLPLSTMKHPDLHSYRLSGGAPGRQFSFAVLLEKSPGPDSKSCFRRALSL